MTHITTTHYPTVSDKEATTTVYPTVQPLPDKEAKVYPSAPPDNYRLNTITQIQRELESDLTKYHRTKRRYTSTFNTLTYLSTGATTITTVMAGTGAGLLATGIGVVAAVPLGFTSLGLGALSFLCTVANKKVLTKVQKHTAMVQLITAKLISFRLIISKALNDSIITDEEFRRLNADYEDYKRQKFDLQKKSMSSFAQPQDVNSMKEEWIQEVSAALISTLKK